MAKKAKVDTKHLTRRGGVWYVQYRMADGRRIVQSTRTADLATAQDVRDRIVEPLTLSQERQRMAAVQAAIATVDDRLAEIEDSTPHLTVREAWRVFVDAPKGRNDRGRVIQPGVHLLAEMESKWFAFAEWLAQRHPTPNNEAGQPTPRELRSVTPEQCREYIAHIEKTRSPRTRNKVLSLLRLVFRIIGKQAGCKINPLDNLLAIKYAVAKKRGLNLEQLQALSNAVAGTGEMERLFLIGFHTGARLGDCCRMRWEDVNLTARELRYLPHKSAKTNRDVLLAITPPLLANLKTTPACERKGPILPELNKLYKKDGYSVSKKVQSVFRKAGIEPSEEVDGCAHKVGRYGFHSLRAAFITTALQHGAVIEDVRQAVGHSCVEMTAGYYRGGTAARNVALLATGTTAPSPAEKTLAEARRKRLLAKVRRMPAAKVKRAVLLLLAVVRVPAGAA